jgi:hypothetical protein
MVKRAAILIFLFFNFTLICQSQETVKDSLLTELVTRFGQARVKIPNPGIRIVNDLTKMVSISSVNKGIVEIVLSPLTVRWFISQKFDYEIIEQQDSKSIIAASDIKQAMEWDSYPTYLQYVTIMQDFSSLYPSLCRLDTVGTSVYGKLVLALKISDNAVIDEDEPQVFYSSSIHGDETGGFVLMLRLADYLLKNYSTNSRLKDLVDNLEIWINPLANPDGAYLTGNTISSSSSRYNANGIDLNRDFPDPVDEHAIKQTETLDMIKFMRAHKFVISANFHAGKEVVNYPWDRWSRLHADDDWFYNISRKYADTVHQYAVPDYMTYLNNGVTNGYDWYRVYGGRQDFMTYELQGREVTIELDDNFITPSANLNALWQYNWRSLLGYLENALYGIHGSVRNKTTGEPVAAKVFVAGHDTDSSHVYSDTLTGSFVRLIAQGAWDIEFTAKGYLNKILNVSVLNGQKTDILVEMVPYIIPIDTAEMPELIFYPNPAEEFIKVVLPERQLGNINVRIFNSLGQKVADYNENAVEDFPLFINVKSLSGGVYTMVITNSATQVADRGCFVVLRK